MAKTSSRRRTSEESIEKEESRRKKQRVCTVGDTKVLPYKDKCILCNELVHLYTNNPAKAKSIYSRPDNITADKLKKRLLKTANERLQNESNDKWAIEVKGRLMGINDLVAEESLLHKRCNTNFLCGGNQNAEGESGRKKDDSHLKQFNELCDWLEEEMEHNLFTLDQLHRKLLSFFCPNTMTKWISIVDIFLNDIRCNIC